MADLAQLLKSLKESTPESSDSLADAIQKAKDTDYDAGNTPDAAVAPQQDSEEKTNLAALANSPTTSKLLGATSQSDGESDDKEDEKLTQVGGDLDKYTKLLQAYKASRDVASSPSETEDLPSESSSDQPKPSTPTDGPTYNKAALQAAMAKKNRGNALADLLDAGATIGSAIAGTQYNPHAFDNARTAGARDLENFNTVQKADDDDIKRQLDKISLKNGLDSKDPNSQKSINLRSLYAKALPQIANMEGFSNMSANDLNEAKGPLEIAEKLKSHKEEMALKYAQLASDKADKADAKTSQQQNQALYQTLQMAEGARQSPDVQQALKDRYAASKANAILNNPNFKNPDNLSNQQVHLLVSEVAKIAQGGVPAQGELSAMMPDTVRSKLSGLYSKLTNEPTPAHAGEFIKQYKAYLDDLNDNANKVINSRLGRVIDLSKGRVGEENYNNLKGKYPEAFNDSSAQQKNQLSDEDKQALDWANQNPTDPRAKKIKEKLGM